MTRARARSSLIKHLQRKSDRKPVSALEDLQVGIRPLGTLQPNGFEPSHSCSHNLAEVGGSNADRSGAPLSPTTLVCCRLSCSS